jgi:hypothetical protein
MTAISEEMPHGPTLRRVKCFECAARLVQEVLTMVIAEVLSTDDPVEIGLE